ncbi:MAG: hypothetical protein HY320_07460 [Armatimonadetes bacterium]|nr:hypothetical protein [Armatimonadota bacterium]
MLSAPWRTVRGAEDACPETYSGPVFEHVWSDAERSRRFWVHLAILVAVGLVLHLARWGLVADARAAARPVREQLALLRGRLDALQPRLARARQRHLPRYLRGLEVQDQVRSLVEAESCFKQADRAAHPDQIRQRTAEAEALLSPALGAADSLALQLTHLDQALDQYQAVRSQLEAACDNALQAYQPLRQEGYRAEHFTHSLALLDTARAAQQRAARLSQQQLENQLPDYLAIYDLCQVALRDVTGAREGIQAIPALRASNEQRLQSFPRALEAARAWGPPARAAAALLEGYPRYRMLPAVEAAVRQLTEGDPRWARAAQANGMDRQEFALAARLLAEAEAELAQRRALLQQAIDRAEELRAVVTSLDGARDAAERAIRRAQDHLNRYRHNRQHAAESRLRRARSSLTNGDGLRTADPIAAFAHCRAAGDEAERAYRAVDTSPREESSYRGAPGGPWGGSWGGSSGGGPSSPGGGGFQSSPGGGGFRSSPGGGGFGGGL